MSPNSSTGLSNRFGSSISDNSGIESGLNGLTSYFDRGFVIHWYTIAIIVAGILLLSVIFVLAINWFLKERKCRKLRHRLIPMYTFDPNEIDVWDEEFLNSNQALKPKDYQSIKFDKISATPKR